jgi:flagellar hook-associated protein 1
MAVSTFLGLQTSLRGLLAHQRSLDVTGHNVANASTVGYSRQEAELTAALPQLIPAGARYDGSGAQLGTGVELEDIRRIRDGFLDVQYRAQASVLGDADARARSLEGVDLALAEPSDNGLAAQLGKLWSAWAGAANDPSSVPARQALVEQARTVAAGFAELDRQLAAVQQQAASEYAALTAYRPQDGVLGDVGQIATELAQVGAAIRDAVLTGQTPNDLMDHRDLLLDKLAQLGSVTVVDLGDGGVRVHFGGAGQPLVDDQRVDDPATPGDDRVVFDPAALTAPGGRLGALLALGAPDGVLDTYRAELAGVAQSLATAVNALHSQGPGGLPFFSFDPALGASGLTVARTAADVRLSRSGAAGANDLALEIAALRGGAVDAAYGSFVARVGSDVKQNARVQANAEVLVDAVEDRRQAAAGVSLDEEMTNLIRFQRGYQASARTMSTLDEMLDVLINRTGRVGL